jgi:hypothetical protein
MAIVYQGSGKLVIGSATPNNNISLNCSSISLEVGYDSLEATTMGAVGHKFVSGLQTVNVSAAVFLEYGATTVEKIISDLIGDGDTTITVSPDDGAAGVTNPTWTITNAMISSAMVVNSVAGSLDTMTLTATGGSWVRATA